MINDMKCLTRSLRLVAVAAFVSSAAFLPGAVLASSATDGNAAVITDCKASSRTDVSGFSCGGTASQWVCGTSPKLSCPSGSPTPPTCPTNHYINCLVASCVAAPACACQVGWVDCPASSGGNDYCQQPATCSGNFLPVCSAVAAATTQVCSTNTCVAGYKFCPASTLCVKDPGCTGSKVFDACTNTCVDVIIASGTPNANTLTKFVTSNSIGNSVVIENSGAIGIGTTPAAGVLLDINNGAIKGGTLTNAANPLVTGNLLIQPATGTSVIVVPKTNNTQTFSVQDAIGNAFFSADSSNQRIAIGTLNPSYKLTIVDSSPTDIFTAPYSVRGLDVTVNAVQNNSIHYGAYFNVSGSNLSNVGVQAAATDTSGNPNSWDYGGVFNGIGGGHVFGIKATADNGVTETTGLYLPVNSNTAGSTTYGINSVSAVTGTGTTTNYGAKLMVTGGTNAYGLWSEVYGAFAGNKYPGIFMGGNVGIGSTTPGATLDVAGDVRTSTRFCIGASCISSFVGADAGGTIDVNRINFRNTDGGDDTDPYNIRKSRDAYNVNHLDLQLNDDADESFRIYGNSCSGFACGDTSGNLYHFFRADGTAYHAGSVGIGTQSPNAKLDVAGGNILAEQVVYARHLDGKNWNNNDTVGDLYLQWNNYGNNTLLNANPSNTGNVGVGTSSPNARLHVYSGSGNIGSTGLGGIALSGGTWHGLAIDGTGSTKTLGIHYGADADNTLRFGRYADNFGGWEANVAYFDMDAPDNSLNLGSTGKLAVGSTGLDYAPSGYNWNYTLQLNAQDTSSIGFHDAGASVSSIRYSNAGFVIGADDGWGGKSVGIGMTPGKRLDVAGDIRGSGEITGTLASGYGQFRMIAGNYGSMFRQDGADTYLLLTNSGDQYGQWNSKRPFRVNNSSGDVYLGATSISTTPTGSDVFGARVHIGDSALGDFNFAQYANCFEGCGSGLAVNYGTTKIAEFGSGSMSLYGQMYVSTYLTVENAVWANSTIYLRGDLSMSSGGDIWMAGGKTVRSSGRLHVASGEHIYLLPYGSGGTVYVSNAWGGSGNLEVSGGAWKPGGGFWGVSSDRRIKDDIRPFSSGLDIVRKIEPKEFTYNGLAGMPRGMQGIGVIAQDVKNVMPYAVSTMKKKLHPEDELETDVYMFDGSALPFILVNAIKEMDSSMLKISADGMVIIPGDLQAENNRWGSGSGWVSCPSDGSECSCPEGSYITKIRKHGDEVFCNKL